MNDTNEGLWGEENRPLYGMDYIAWILYQSSALITGYTCIMDTQITFRFLTNQPQSNPVHHFPFGSIYLKLVSTILF